MAWVLCIALAGCSPDTGSDRYGIRHFAGRWTPTALTRIDYLHASPHNTATRTPEGYFHLEIDQVKDDNSLYVASELVQVLDMLRLQREAGAYSVVAGGEEGAFIWDWRIDEAEFSIIGVEPANGEKILSLMAISGRDRENMTLTYTETLSDSSYFEEVLVLRRQ